MEHITDLLTYSERPAANRNGDPTDHSADYEHIKAQRDRVEKMLADPRLVGKHRENMEMYFARANRYIKDVDATRQRFNQNRLLAKMRPL